MPNRHFAEIGDIWKHLPLASILLSEKQGLKQYWETHSGSALYDFKQTDNDLRWKKDYGAHYFYKQSIQSKILNKCAFRSTLSRWDNNGNLTHYPGSPLISLLYLSDVANSFVFCDIDPISLDSISSVNSSMNLSNSIELLQKDGMDSIWEKLHTCQNVDSVFVFIDPYDIFAPSTTHSKTSVDILIESIQLGAKVGFWYGFDSSQDKQQKESKIKDCLHKANISTNSLWWGSIQYEQIDHLSLNPGVPGGCSLILANCSSETVSQCQELGKELEAIYKTALLPDNSSGAIAFLETK